LAVEYLKIIRRLEKEQKNYDFLTEKMLESERDLVQVRREGQGSVDYEGSR